MVGQLLLPSVALATEYADPAAATVEAAAAPVTPTVAEDTAATTAPAASTAPATDAAPAAQATVEPQQTIPADAANESSGAALAGQNASGDDNAAMPASNAIMPCGVTDVVGGSDVRVNTTVVPRYTDCVLPCDVTLEKGQPYTYDDFPDVEGGIPETLASEVVEVKYYRANAASGTLVEVQDASMSDVTARFEPVGNHMRLTLTFTGGAAGGSYRLTRNEALYIGAALEYTGTDYEGSSTILNETRYDYYLRYAINSEITLVASENEAIHNLDVNDVKTDYAPGEAPRATATIPTADADKYEIAYECWEEMDGSDPAELTPVAFWYSDPAKYPTGARRIEHFEEGKFYMYSVELRLKGDNTVADDCMMYVNGHWAHHIKTVNGVFAPNADNMLCEAPIDEWRAIDLIEINGAMTTFKAGDRPVFTAGTPAGSDSILQCEFWTGSDGSEVNSVEFWDQHITNHIDAFKPGVTYRYGLYFKPARGFYFTPNTKLKINGVECGYQVSEASEVDPESGWIFTLWLNTNLTFTPETTPAPDPQPTPDPNPTPQPETKPEAKPEAKPSTKPATTTTVSKTVEKTTQAKKSAAVLAATGDTTAMTVTALGIAGATVAAAGIAATKRRKR
ncbi:LPXTG cell wall anchor domain-containing protein [Collinsella sp. AM10-11]|nr:LPXTG cell wall anchor domain-containing protein [Collinsella sp. AM10-48]RHJ38010.1 LPXTG cell wall anchor domain-containing protein [Collinsella sp. AM10-32]RHJ43648.1 LPXTG cell wall anchor domain-containing protein [Collinsella sp. AM10-26]RHJ44860.1 LPXTG cell wall anchor domain-containing protein [Collinsella sp. AM10-27]RHJ54581.1 LPXTG cell wall anchor domain-containing protein [Collinsella sp. AM10-11]